MATRKDQLDAFNFARRRMVANLIAPTATGSDEGAPRPLKTFATSLVLSGLAVAGVAVLGVFKPAAPQGWQAGLAVDANTGAAYIESNNELHPVFNITSAKLILGTKFQKFDVPDSDINAPGTTIGAAVGIAGAPEDVPPATNMDLTQWSLCQHEGDATNEGQPNSASSSYLEIGYTPDSNNTTTSLGVGAGATTGLIVHDSAGEVYFIDGDYRYDVGNVNAPDVTNGLPNGEGTVSKVVNAIANGTFQQQQQVQGFWVSDAWLGAFTAGGQLTYPVLQSTAGTFAQNGQSFKVGDYGQLANGNGWVATSGGMVQLDPFAFALYSANPNVAGSGATEAQQQMSMSEFDGFTQVQPSQAFTTGQNSTYSTNWPSTPPNLDGNDTTEATFQNLCVGFSGKFDGQVPQLSTWASPTLPYGTAGSQFGLSQTSSNAEANTVLVQPGFGLIAESVTGGANSTGKPFLIEDSGYRYELVTDPAPSSGSSGSSGGTGPSAIVQLGYSTGSGVSAENVPTAWVDLLQGGAALDPNQAGVAPQTGN